ncbi:MAG: DUF5615 family PIN-like protein [Firmicutes bacterium]|nr:DUF5615 family PIN-like protein [Bacillota bacterium]
MRFLADMGISLKTVIWLRNEGHEVVHLSEQGLQRISDEEIFKKGIEESRIILTMDLDFSQILAASKSELPSVIIFRLSDERSENINKRLSELMDKCCNELVKGSIISVTDTKFRIRRLPIF